MANYKIIVEYDGSGFSGWQLQKGTRTVQGDLESALRTLNSGRTVRVHGSGRTDSGVHARGQVANFSLEKDWPASKLVEALNGNLDEDVRVHSCEAVPDDFHARFSAKSRTYRYRCSLTPQVIDRRTIWYVPPPVSLIRLRKCAQLILGDHDFTSFSKGPSQERDRRCEVLQSQWIKRGDYVTFAITANRFLRHMVCYLVGTMMQVGRGSLTESSFKEILEMRNPGAGVFRAPPHGLSLERVSYS